MLVNQLGSFLSLMDTKDITRVGLGVTKNGGGMSLLDENTKEPVGTSAPDTP
jgi:hypothetical protein